MVIGEFKINWAKKERKITQPKIKWRKLKEEEKRMQFGDRVVQGECRRLNANADLILRTAEKVMGKHLIKPHHMIKKLVSEPIKFVERLA